jgi:hypothetical protein
MKTAQEILRPYGKDNSGHYAPHIVIKAMEEYAQQFTSKQIPEIVGWKNIKTGEFMEVYNQLPHPNWKPVYFSPQPKPSNIDWEVIEEKIQDFFMIKGLHSIDTDLPTMIEFVKSISPLLSPLGKVVDGFEKYLHETSAQIRNTVHSGGSSENRTALEMMDERIANVYDNIISEYKSFIAPLVNQSQPKEVKQTITDERRVSISAQEMKYLCTTFANKFRPSDLSEKDINEMYVEFIKEYALPSHKHLILPNKEKSEKKLNIESDRDYTNR